MSLMMILFFYSILRFYRKGGNMSFEPKLEINVEIPFETLAIDGLEK